jgi:hypothetical protein
VLQLLRRLAARFRAHDVSSPPVRDVDNLDAIAAAKAREGINPFDPGMSGYPPGYVKSYDEGRPRT